MPKQNGQGVSGETDTKQQNLTGFLSMHMNIVNGIFQRRPRLRKPYIYLDLYSGTGDYVSECDGSIKRGSPLIFLTQAAKIGIDIEPAFFDNGQDGETIKALESKVKSSYPYFWRKCSFHGGDNFMEIRPYLGNIPKHHRDPRYSQHINANRYGLIYADNNNKDIDTTWQMLSMFSRCATYRQVDILIYLSATNIKRIANGETRYNLRLTDYMRMIDKQHVIVRETHTHQQWLFMCFTNWAKFPEWEKKGWFRSDTDAGRAIIRHANYTADEKRNMVCPSPTPQLTLFDV